MSYSQKYCLVSFVEPVEAGAEFDMTNWPLHITLADVFAVDVTAELCDKLAVLFAQQTPFDVIAGREAVLGETKVVLIEKSDELTGLHNRLVDLLKSDTAMFNNPEFTQEGYLPHCTIQKAGRLRVGDKVNIAAVALIGMFPRGDWQQRKVLQTFRFKL